MVAEGKDVRKSVAAREEGNMKFQEGSYQVVTPHFVTVITYHRSDSLSDAALSLTKYQSKPQAALNKYSVAVAWADQGKPDYSLALANRWDVHHDNSPSIAS